jgi:hypothetical protein
VCFASSPLHHLFDGIVVTGSDKDLGTTLLALVPLYLHCHFDTHSSNCGRRNIYSVLRGMASADVLIPQRASSFGSVKRKRSISQLDNMATKAPRRPVFDPARHLDFQPPKKIWTMEEIGFADKGVSPIAVSEPFPLFTQETIDAMRAEVLSKPVMENCRYSSNLAKCQLRGFASE